MNGSVVTLDCVVAGADCQVSGRTRVRTKALGGGSYAMGGGARSETG